MAVRGRWRTSKEGRKAYAVCIAGLAVVAISFAVFDAFSQSADPGASAASRQLLCASDHEDHVTLIPGLNGKCNASWEVAQGGLWATLIYLLIVIYMFLGIAILCDNAFTDSLEMICSEHGLNLPEDVAGATFMAAGSSAPELATSFVGVFIAKNEVGLGTILGSAVFNILIIIGATALLAGQTLCLDWRPVVRDNFFYSISVIILCICASIDEEIDWVDAMLLLLWYVAYIVFMYFNEAFWARFSPNPVEEDPEDSGTASLADGPTASKMRIVEGPEQLEMESVRGSDPVSGSGSGAGSAADGKDGKEEGMAQASELQETKVDDKPKKKRHASFSTGTWRHHGEEEENEEDSIAEKILNVFSWPWEKAYEYTIPDCHLELLDPEDEEQAEVIDSLKEQIEEESDPDKKAEMEKELRTRTEPEYEDLNCGQKWYVATFFLSLLWLTGISYFMVEFILKLGCIWKISAVVMGITFLAMGTSIPDALGSISVARDGLGDMAVSNAVGSNVFDICLGLGLPWFIDTAIIEPGKIFKINDIDSVTPSIIILLSIIVVLFASFLVSNWQLKPWVGYVLFSTYIVFVIYQVVRAKIVGC